MSSARLEEIRALLAAATPPPWKWRWTRRSHRDGPELVNPRHGLLLVMDFVRSGMQGATARFATRNPTDRGGVMRLASAYMPVGGPTGLDYPIPDNPDMRLIADGREMLAELLGTVDAQATLIETLKRERDQFETLWRGRHDSSGPPQMVCVS